MAYQDYASGEPDAVMKWLALLPIGIMLIGLATIGIDVEREMGHHIFFGGGCLQGLVVIWIGLRPFLP